MTSSQNTEATSPADKHTTTDGVKSIRLSISHIRNAINENTETASVGTVGKFLGLVFFAGFMVLAHKVAGTNRRHNAQIHPRLVNRWQAAWICLRCGKRWIPEK